MLDHVAVIIYIGTRDRWRPVLYIDFATLISLVSMACDNVIVKLSFFSSKADNILVVNVGTDTAVFLVLYLRLKILHIA